MGVAPMRGWSGTGDGAEAFARGHGGVRAGDVVVVLVLGDVDPVAGAVHGGPVVDEGVARTPAVEDAMGLEAVLRRVGADVPDDLPFVALDVDPGVGGGHARPGERVAAQRAPGRALFDVHGLGRGLGDVVVLDDVAVAAVGLAVRVGAPVALGAADVDALTELLGAESGGA